MAEEVPGGPVDYDDRSDPDCPSTAGDAVVNAIGFTGCLTCEQGNGVTIFIWAVNSAEQIEARLAEMGWELQRTRPWKK